MKKFLILILLLLINKTFSQKENELARKMRMENKIEEVEFYDINIKNSDTLLIEHDYYNNYGNIIKNKTKFVPTSLVYLLPTSY